MKCCLAALLIMFLWGFFACAYAEITVGDQIAASEIEDFYYTVDAPLADSVYLRYRFYAQQGEKLFYHESRQGGSWPLSEEDTVFSGTVELKDEEWNAFFDCLKGGSVKAPDDEVLDGDSGPWTYLYWTGDDGKIRKFSFASYEKRIEFETLCSRLAHNHILTRFAFSRGGYMVPQSYEVFLKNGDYFIRENDGEPRALDESLAAELKQIVSTYNIASWDGFHESDPNVLDGEDFWLELSYADGTTVCASGSNAFPENYFDAVGAVETVFEKEKMSRIAGVYRYEGDGFGGEFLIILDPDGTYSFYEGPLSSYLGGGKWNVFYNAVYMTEENGFDLSFVFCVEDDCLVYLAMGSDAFPYVKVSDGERFVRLDAEKGA